MLRLIVHGLTHRAIASELFISERTVHRHVTGYELAAAGIERAVETANTVAFDPERRAILLVAGDKAGNWSR